MAGIQTGIELQDNFTSVIMGIINSVNIAVSVMDSLDQSISSGINTAAIQGARDEINDAAAAASQLSQEFMGLAGAPAIRPAQPVEWKSDALTPVVDVSGLERYQQEVQRTEQTLASLTSTQSRISQAAVSMDILPETAVQDIALLGTRLDAIKNKIQEIENNPVTMGTDAANRQLEQLYAQLYRATQEQENLGRAMDSMDISGINSTYMRLSQTISGTERYLRDNEDAQDSFNQSVERCRAPAEHVRGSFSGWEKAIIVANNAIGLIENTLGRLGVFDISGAFGRIDTMDRFQKTITTMTGDAGMAEAALAQLKDTTVGTAYGLDVAGAATQGFLTRGMSLGAATDQVRIWADAVSFYGKGTNEQLESVVDAIGKMYSKGSVEADQLDRLFDAGIDAAGIYAEVVGESVAKVKDALSNKNISSAEFIGTVSQAMDNGVSSGAAKEAGDTWEATFSNVQSAVTRGWADIIQSLDNELAAHGLPSSMEVVQSFGQTVEGVLGSVADNMGTVVAWGTRIADTLSGAGTFIADNWGTIGPVVYGAAAALTVFAIAMGVVKAVTVLAAAAQFIFASPLILIISIIAILIGVIIALANHFSGAGHVAQSTFGAICGGVNVVIHFFLNMLDTGQNVALGLWNALRACAGNIQTAFHNTGCNIKSFFYGLVSTVLTVIETICKALNKLPFIEFDYSGVCQAADNYAAKSAEAAAEKKEYVSISDAFKRGMNTYKTFKDGWVDDAYREGAAWGDGVTEKVKDFFNPGNLYKDDGNNQGDYDPHGLAQDTSLIAGNTNDTAKNTAKAANGLEITGEELKYLRNMADRDYINKFTTAEIKVNMTNHNKIDKELDIDGLSSKFCKKIEEELASSAEGVH